MLSLATSVSFISLECDGRLNKTRQSSRNIPIANTRLRCRCCQHRSVLQPYRYVIYIRLSKTLCRLRQSGYACVKGQKTTVDTIQALFDGLRINGLGGYAKILTGYVPGSEALEVVEKEIKSLKEQDPETIYILDRR